MYFVFNLIHGCKTIVDTSFWHLDSIVTHYEVIVINFLPILTRPYKSPCLKTLFPKIMAYPKKDPGLKTHTIFYLIKFKSVLKLFKTKWKFLTGSYLSRNDGAILYLTFLTIDKLLCDIKFLELWVIYLYFSCHRSDIDG